MKQPGFFKRSELTRTLATFKREFMLVGLFSLVANVLMLTPTIYMLQIYDRVLAGGSELTLLAVSLIALFLFGVIGLTERARSRLLVHAGVRLDERLSTQVFNASFEASLNPTSNAHSRTFNDLVLVRQFVTGNGIFAFFDAPWTPVYMGVLFFLHPTLGWLAVFFALVQASLGWFGHRHTLAPAETASKSLSDANTYLQGKLRNAEVLESMGMVGSLENHWLYRHENYLDQNHGSLALTHRITAWSKFIRYAQQSLVLGAGALLVIDGQLTPGGMIAANVLTTRALSPIDQIVGIWNSFAAVKAGFKRLEALLISFPARPQSQHNKVPLGQLDLHNVVAKAAGRSRPILDGIDLAVPAGSVVVIMGPSGSGKSTLARVITGIWPDVSGEVLLDGERLSNWNRHDLGPHLGYLPQDVELFEGTIAENIARLGEVDSEKVISAARSAGLHEMILRFPKGYDTGIGEAGGILSGGQRQRLALARAIYGEPTLIVLDEPNANLDDTGEAALLQAVHELKEKGKTVILVTHRPGAVAAADMLVLIREGRIVASGPKDTVLASMRTQAANKSAVPMAPQAQLA